jgi:hypothetical protein
MFVELNEGLMFQKYEAHGAQAHADGHYCVSGFHCKAGAPASQ